jgi:hypothetical protein
VSFEVTTATDNGTYQTWTITPKSSAGTLSNTDVCTVSIQRSGDPAYGQSGSTNFGTPSFVNANNTTWEDCGLSVTLKADGDYMFTFDGQVTHLHSVDSAIQWRLVVNGVAQTGIVQCVSDTARGYTGNGEAVSRTWRVLDALNGQVVKIQQYSGNRLQHSLVHTDSSLVYWQVGS